MSGFWIKWEKGLTRKPEVMQIAARLMIQPTDAAGRLMLVMEWLDDAVTELSRDGHAEIPLKSLPLTFIDGIAGLPGFTEALAEVGWVTTKDNTLTFINVGRHNGTSAKSRALANDRKKKERSRSCHDNVTPKKAVLCSVSVSALSSVSEESIYQAYPRKQGKKEALKAITKALASLAGEAVPRDGAWLLERVQAYASAVAKWPPGDAEYVPHPSTWFNRGSYDDDPAAWVRNRPAGNGRNSPALDPKFDFTSPDWKPPVLSSP